MSQGQNDTLHRDLVLRLGEAEATIHALLAGQIDAVFGVGSKSPVLLLGAQRALRESEERYRSIVEATSDGIVKVDSSTSIAFVNRRFADMLGYTPGEMLGASLFAFMSEDARVVVAAAMQVGPSVGDARDTSFRHKNGSEVPVDMAITPLVDGANELIGNLAMVRDVSQQKKLQSQLMASDRMASVGTLAAGVAHEINNPLAAVIANLDYIAEMLQRADAPGSARSDAWLLEELKAPLADARDGARRVRLIVRDLKVFSRAPDEEPRAAVDTRAIMESSLRMAWNEIRHRARLVKQYEPVPKVVVNEARLGQVFLNLLVNAAQALPEGHAEQNEVRVRIGLAAERVVIEVSDTGVGIPPEIIGRIFDPFFTTKAVGVGTGLGLAICQRLVTDMGGTLTVESQAGVGTSFRVALPVPRDEPSKVAAVSEHAALSGRRGRILVVDDEELIARAVQRALSKDHEVVVSVAAVDALALCLSGEKFDLILCDLMMPDMSGMDLHRELSLAAPAQADRMVFLTGGAFTNKARQFLTETAKEHIEKPFDVSNLRGFVQRYLRSSS